jgi:hypothetical protein
MRVQDLGHRLQAAGAQLIGQVVALELVVGEQAESDELEVVAPLFGNDVRLLVK